VQLIVVDGTVEKQTVLARRVHDLGQDEIERLDITIGLSDIVSLDKKLSTADVVLLGPGISSEAFAITRKIKEFNPNTHVVAFVTDNDYSTGAFLKLRGSGMRIVLPLRSTPLDLLQVLLAIDTELKLHSSKAPGQLTLFANGKGGLGNTTLIAGLGSFFALRKRSALLWDLDIETRDLSRAMLKTETRSARLTEFVKGDARSTKCTLKAACVKWQNEVSILPPPDVLAAGLDLISHPDSISLIDEIVEAARELFDHIIVDLGGRLGPGAARLMQSADNICLLVDDSWMGLTATATYLNAISPIMHDNFSTIRFVGAGSKLSPLEIRAVLEKQSGIKLEERAFQTSTIPFDVSARKWPGSGETLFSIGSKLTRQAMIQIGEKIDLPLQRTIKAKPIHAEVELVPSEIFPEEQLDVSHPFAAKPELAKNNRPEFEHSHSRDF